MAATTPGRPASAPTAPGRPASAPTAPGRPASARTAPDRPADPATDRPRLGIDPVACDGVGICGYQAPELIRVDSWGFPILPAGPLAAGQLTAAARAVAACPRRALFLTGPAGGA